MLNTTPVFVKTPKVSWTTLLTATGSNPYLGTGTNVQVAFSASADGSFVECVRFKALGTNIQSVARIFINNGGDPTIAANNTLIDEVTLPVTAASSTGAVMPIEQTIGLTLQAGHRILASLGTTVAAGWQTTVFAADLG